MHKNKSTHPIFDQYGVSYPIFAFFWLHIDQIWGSIDQIWGETSVPRYGEPCRRLTPNRKANMGILVFLCGPFVMCKNDLESSLGTILVLVGEISSKMQYYLWMYPIRDRVHTCDSTHKHIAGIIFSVPSVALSYLVVSRYGLRTFLAGRSREGAQGSVCALCVQSVGGHQRKTRRRWRSQKDAKIGNLPFGGHCFREHMLWLTPMTITYLHGNCNLEREGCKFWYTTSEYHCWYVFLVNGIAHSLEDWIMPMKGLVFRSY